MGLLNRGNSQYPLPFTVCIDIDLGRGIARILFYEDAFGQCVELTKRGASEQAQVHPPLP